MTSILDQLDNYYAKKRGALDSTPVPAPFNLRHPNASEFFADMMKRQKDDTANGNASAIRENRVETPAYESSLVSA